MKKIVYVDMDGVLCDYIGRCKELGLDPDAAKRVPGFFSSLKPIDGAIEAYRELNAKYDVYILTATSWSNPGACVEKIEWVNRYLPEAYKRVIFSHNKHLCQGDYLIDNRAKCGADLFTGQWIQFGSEGFPDWESVVTFIDVYSMFDDDGYLNYRAIESSMVDDTIKWLDTHMELLNKEYEANPTDELRRRILLLAKLTNKWLAAKEKDESSYYDI